MLIKMDSLVQDYSNSIANAMELLQSCTKPLNYIYFKYTVLCAPVIPSRLFTSILHFYI